MDIDQLRFFNPYAEVVHTANRLPHWQQSGAVYFITFRLADVIPAQLRAQLQTEREAWLSFHPTPWTAQIEREYHQRFTAATEHWLDAGHGSCVLQQPKCAKIVSDALSHFEGERYAQLSWVIMPKSCPLPVGATCRLAARKSPAQLEAIHRQID